jgi:hypothetical protein
MRLLAMILKRRRFKRSHTLEDRLPMESSRLREEAETMKAGPAREDVLRKVRQAETGAHMSAWLRSPGVQAPQ